MRHIRNVADISANEIRGSMRNLKEFYFRLSLTENEHYIVNDMFEQKCHELDLTLLYYRKLKKGHVPGIREIKVAGGRTEEFIRYLKEDNFLLVSQEDREVQDKYGIESVERAKLFGLI